MQTFEVAIIGAGPAGLQAALTLGRANRRVLLIDDEAPPRNAKAIHIHNFVTRDGTVPSDFRKIAKDQLKTYPAVTLINERVVSIENSPTQFQIKTLNQTFDATYTIVATGMVDEMLNIDGFKQAWGDSIYQCPYCHGWEVKDQRWGYLATSDFPIAHGFVEILLNWSDDVVVFAGPGFQFSSESRETLERLPVSFETREISQLVVENDRLSGITFADGAFTECRVLYAHPPQRQTELVQSLGLELDEMGFVKLDPESLQTSVDRLYVAGDATTFMQSAMLAASSGLKTAGLVNHKLSVEKFAM